MKTKQFVSEFDNNISVAIIGKNDYRYGVLKTAFDKFGFGFMIPNENVVFINGTLGLNKHILKWIEAHEIAHFMCGHSQVNPNDEIEADRLAYLLLDGKGYDKAARMVKDKFKERHGIEF